LGGRVFDDRWNPIVNNEAGVQAAEALKTIIGCGPEGAKNFGFGEALGVGVNGDTAMLLDTTVVAGQIDDPSKSQVVGKVGWVLHPMGVRRGSQTGGFGIGILSNAENKKAAFLSMQWLTSKRGDKPVALADGNPSRFSTNEGPDVNAKFPHMATFGEALKYANPDWRRSSRSGAKSTQISAPPCPRFRPKSWISKRRPTVRRTAPRPSWKKPGTTPGTDATPARAVRALANLAPKHDRGDVLCRWPAPIG